MILPVVGYAGMTHLGINSAVAAAERGARVVCYDHDAKLVASLNSRVLHVVEPDLPETLAKNSERMTFTSQPATLHDCDLVYIAVDVPTDDSGRSDLTPITEMISAVEHALNDDCVLVILSQVPPGFTRAIPRDDAQCIYQVETLVFGQAVERALNPERLIVGCSSPNTPLPPAYKSFLEAFDCPILPMRYESAELCKISINACLVASVSTANTLAEICEKVGADWSEITPALRLDRRIGRFSYLNPGLGIAGGNLERDLATIVRLASEHGTDSGVVRAWVKNSQHRRDWVLNRLHESGILSMPDACIAVLGMAYKENTASTKNSPSLALLGNLPSSLNVRAYDPVVTAIPSYHPGIQHYDSALEAVRDAGAVVIMTPWPEFRDLVPRDIADAMSGSLVIDPYALWDKEPCHAAGLTRMTLGVSYS